MVTLISVDTMQQHASRLNGTERSLEKVAILDYGAQYGKIVDCKIRELKVDCDIVPLDTSVTALRRYSALIITGPAHGNNVPACDRQIFQCGIPVLGIGCGIQMINSHFGGIASKSAMKEDCQLKVKVDTKCPLFNGLTVEQSVLLAHGESVTTIASGFSVIASFGDTIAGIGSDKQRIYGIQFRPECDIADSGKQILRNFVVDIAKCRTVYTIKSRREAAVQYIRDTVGDHKVLILVSGGVDSSACAALLQSALKPDQLIALHIEHGFMRGGETAKILQSLKKLGLKIHTIDACHRFYNSTTLKAISSGSGHATVHTDGRTACRQKTKMLCQTTDPDEKRRIIADTFMHVANELLLSLNTTFDEVFFVQATLRSDVVENMLGTQGDKGCSTSYRHSEVISELSKRNRIVEPLQDFYKPEVRAIGRELGLLEDLVERHPFPAPGLAVRVVCAEQPNIEKDFSEIVSLVKIICDFPSAVQKTHALLNRVKACMTDTEQVDLLRICDQTHLSATLLPIKSVGLQGDSRTYSCVVGLSSDNKTTNWESELFIARLITRVCPNISRVVHTFGSRVKESSVTDVTPTLLTQNVLAFVRTIDDAAHKILNDAGHLNKISQMPVVLIPIHFDRDMTSHMPSCQRSVVIRPFITADHLTGVAAVPGKHLPEEVVHRVVNKIKGFPGISRVLYDLTSKPPGVAEWE